MRKNLLAVLFISALCLCTKVSQAQLKINQHKKMYLGDPNVTCIPHDPFNVLTGSILGPYTGCRAGSKLAFGDFGNNSVGSWNVFVGEYTNTDTDQLWLHGKNGFYLTKGGKADDIVLYSPKNPKSNVHFTANVFAANTLTNSDIRFKSNIREIDDPLNRLMSLQGLSYDYNDKERLDVLKAQQGEIIYDEPEEPVSLTEKELADIEALSLIEETLLQKEPRLGFIAQEVQEVFPDLVKEDDLGYLAIDYSGLIPVIVEAMRIQQDEIMEQQRLIQELRVRVEQLENINPVNFPTNPQPTGNTGYLPTNSQAPSIGEGSKQSELTQERTHLLQNSPNPFTEKTEIRYFLPDDSNDAKLYIFNLQGQNVKTVNITGQGNGIITVQGAELAPGTYIYTLYSNGKELDSKRMLLTK